MLPKRSSERASQPASEQMDKVLMAKRIASIKYSSQMQQSEQKIKRQFIIEGICCSLTALVQYADEERIYTTIALAMIYQINFQEFVYSKKKKKTLRRMNGHRKS